ncbi:MAG: MarR family transcriptional regulator [Deltaproteobacteria bacterium]|nr:MarR family transcriptional regulator [Deltaproteobacteria bacterium]
MMERDQNEQVVELLIDEVVALYHLLRAVVTRIHSDMDLTAAGRGVLRGLDRTGPQTVPQMARARPVSRQYIQAVVNQLGKRGLVELIPNPAHKRSSLVRLSARGKKLADAVAQKEEALLAELQIGLSEKELLLASSVLRKLRDCFLEILRDRTAGDDLK